MCPAENARWTTESKPAAPMVLATIGDAAGLATDHCQTSHTIDDFCSLLCPVTKPTMIRNTKGEITSTTFRSAEKLVRFNFETKYKR